MKAQKALDDLYQAIEDAKQLVDNLHSDLSTALEHPYHEERTQGERSFSTDWIRTNLKELKKLSTKLS
jgi:hypothetical protein